jgi:hypothetical protein
VDEGERAALQHAVLPALGRRLACVEHQGEEERRGLRQGLGVEGGEAVGDARDGGRE